jgi:hypothetical protein
VNHCYVFLCVQDVVDMIMRMRRETAGSEPQIVPQIDNLLIIDRTVDPLTPLLTQLTYEGLIDEIFGISNSEFYVLGLFCVFCCSHLIKISVLVHNEEDCMSQRFSLTFGYVAIKHAIITMYSLSKSMASGRTQIRLIGRSLFQGSLRMARCNCGWR